MTLRTVALCCLAIMGFASSNNTMAQQPNRTPPALVVEKSGSKRVDDLVRQLVSTRPAPFPEGYWDIPVELVMENGYRTPEVKRAIEALKALGPPIFTNVLVHLHDDRYCFSDIVAAWNNCTVGEAIMIEIFADGHVMHSGYKFRKTPNGSANYLDFSTWVKEIEETKWAHWASSKTRLEIQTSFIDWCVKKETERGFIDEKQKTQILKRYEEAKRTMAEQYATKNEP